jgi:hypothetical protein
MFELTAIGVLVLIALNVDKALQRNMVVPPPRRTEPRDIVRKKLYLDQMFATRRIDVATYIRGLAALGLSQPDATRKLKLIRTHEADIQEAPCVPVENIDAKIFPYRPSGDVKWTNQDPCMSRCLERSSRW